MEKSFIEDATDIILDTVKDVRLEIKEMFKNTTPYRKERVSNEERIMNYNDFINNPDIEQQWRLEAGDDAVDKYHLDMHELINRRLRNA